MTKRMNRRVVVATMAAAFYSPTPVTALTTDIWSVIRTHEALRSDLIRLIDVRSHIEWTETGVAKNAWPISLHEDRFADRLFAARALAQGRIVAIICATGGRSGRVTRSLYDAGYEDFVDVSEGMLGSTRGPGWIASGLPIVDVAEALQSLPNQLF